MIWKVIDAPLGAGGSRRGSETGPAALRQAGLLGTLRRLGHTTVDLGAPRPGSALALTHPNHAIKALGEIAAWTGTIADATYAASGDARVLVLGGDHSVSAGSVSGIARRARQLGRPLFVLWVDAHPDFHTLDSSVSGNLHGVPLAYVSGQPGFSSWLPPLEAVVDPRRVCTLGTREIDPAEGEGLAAAGVTVHDMAAIDAHGVRPLVETFLDHVAAENGLLHVSFDVDVLDPAVTSAVGTPVPDGMSLAEARTLMEVLHDSDLVTSLDIVELNPSLDEADRTARLVVDLVASLFGGRQVNTKKRA